MRVVTITGEFVNTIPLTSKPGPMLGTTRDNFMRNLFSLAATYGADVRVPGNGLHYGADAPSPAAVIMASDKLSKPEVKRIQRLYANVKPWVGV